MHTTFLLALCALAPQQDATTPPELPSPVAAPVAVAPPPLELQQSESAYRLAMHLIDVRGRYQEGADQLLALVDADDVIFTPGQASWIMAQAARALILDGHADEASKLMPGIRNGSRSTAFEAAVANLLAEIGPQEFGLDAGTLAFVLQELKVTTNAAYSFPDEGRSINAYLQYLLQDASSNSPIDVKKRAFKLLLSRLDEDGGEMLLQTIQTMTPILRNGVMQDALKRINIPPFLDGEAEAAALQFCLQYADRLPEGDLLGRRDAYYVFLIWPNKTATDLATPIRAMVADNLFSLLQDHPETLDWRFAIQLSGAVSQGLASLASVAERLAQSPDLNLREAMRWGFSVVNPNWERQRSWAREGSDMDRIRFGLAFAHRIPNWSDGAVQEWAKGFGIPLDGKAINQVSIVDYQRTVEEDFQVIYSFRESSNPLVRYLGASILQANGRVQESLPFLEEVGPDPIWVKFYLKDFRIRLSEEDLDTLLPYAAEGPITEWVRNLFVSDAGRYYLQMRHVRALHLSLPDSSGEQLVNHLSQRSTDAEKNPADLLWLLQEGLLEGETQLKAMRSLVLGFPRFFLTHFQEIKTVVDWTSLERIDFSQLALNCIQEGDSWLDGVENAVHEALTIPEISTQLFRAILDGSPRFFLLMLNKQPELMDRLEDIDLPTLWARIAQAKNQGMKNTLMMKALDSPRFGKPGRWESFDAIWRWADLNAPESLGIYRRIWALGAREADWDRFPQFLQATIRNEEFRKEFHKDIARHLSFPDEVSNICGTLSQVGAVAEFYEDLLHAIGTMEDGQALATMLSAIAGVEDQRTVPTLMRFLNDPRQVVAGVTQSALNGIKVRREQEAYWAAWANGQEETSVFAALLKDLKDPEEEIRIAAIASLGTLGDPEVLPVLVNLLREDNPRIKEAARQALARINSGPPAERKAEPKEPVEPQEGH